MALVLEVRNFVKENRNVVVRGQDFIGFPNRPTNTAQINKSLANRFSPRSSTGYTKTTSATQKGSNRAVVLVQEITKQC